MIVRVDRVKLITEIAKADTNICTVAAAAGLNRATVGAVKAGKSCTEETAQKIAAALNVPLSALLQEE